ncbi:TrkA family potassium uptake protein [Acaryochloris sp. IP29b_bin.148]|uniref:potassium channel family protein n=1 Tax=Acaryochloris sp. IP29b_bin.148 TaxID=2969218 RepID=UPI002601C337|nr:TrkA family potassium uptake protein [Acaryochloris sp. IP29b_bin.148]
MNLSSLSLFPGLNKKKQQFAVIGLGRFGRAACQALHQAGQEVLGTDIDEKRVAEVVNNQWAAHALQLDSTDPMALKEAGIYEFDTVIIAIGNYLQESIITTLNVKEAGVATVVAKASSEVHGKLLKRVGADQVVFPENEAGYALARALTKPSILDRFELDPQHSIVEIVIPEDFHNKSIGELQLRSRYGLNVLAICGDRKFNVNPSPDLKLQKGAVMVVIGETKAIDELPL